MRKMAEATVTTNSNEKKRKRPRAARACELCRAKKYRCDEMYPCSHCKRQKVDCVYDVADHVRQRMFQLSDNSVQTTTDQNQQDYTKDQPVKLAEDRPNSKQSPTTIISADTQSPQSRSAISGRWTQVNARRPSFRLDELGSRSSVPEDRSTDDHDVEVSDLNPHTQSVEFHGKTSSLAFLAALQPQTSQGTVKPSPGRNSASGGQLSLVSMLHNEAFSPEALATTQNEAAILEHERYYFRQAQVFLEGFFQNIHFIHPILDRQKFMSRCEDLWFGRGDQQSKSFVALYYSLLSLGALIKTWDEDKMDGLGRLEWSRKFFNITRTAIGGISAMTTVESIQCLFFMAKVSQNELNPSLAYLYLGWATRVSCSAGFNRKQPPSSEVSLDKREEIARLWWGMYSLEVEVSFALGRPDSLGADAYHNQILPPLDETETAIISVMVHFARLVREVSLSIYLSEATVLEKTNTAAEIESKMDAWLQSIPHIIRPSIFEPSKASKIMRAPMWAKRQKLVLELRFYNVKMILFRPFLLIAAKYVHDIPLDIQSAMYKCVEAARSTIDLMHDMYCHHAFFRTWWYNTTYILYAASIVLCYGMKVAQKPERPEYLELGQKTVEILDAMEESTVAKNASETIQQILSSAKDIADSNGIEADNEQNMYHLQKPEDNGMPQFDQFADDSFMSFLNLDENLDFLGMTFPLNSSHFPLWADSGNNT